MFVIPNNAAEEVNERLDLKYEDVQENVAASPDYTELGYPWYRLPVAAGCIVEAHSVPYDGSDEFERAELVINGRSYRVMATGSPRWVENAAIVIPDVTRQYSQLIPRKVSHVCSP